MKICEEKANVAAEAPSKPQSTAICCSIPICAALLSESLSLRMEDQRDTKPCRPLALFADPEHYRCVRVPHEFGRFNGG
jgi:hypothetical protein